MQHKQQKFSTDEITFMYDFFSLKLSWNERGRGEVHRLFHTGSTSCGWHVQHKNWAGKILGLLWRKQHTNPQLFTQNRPKVRGGENFVGYFIFHLFLMVAHAQQTNLNRLNHLFIRFLFPQIKSDLKGGGSWAVYPHSILHMADIYSIQTKQEK